MAVLTESERAATTAPVSLLALLDAPFALPDRGLLSQAEQAGQPPEHAFLRPPLAAEVAAAIRKEMRC
jgi:hypothetical protein